MMISAQVGHDYYTTDTLGELEKTYRGFDSDGVYAAAGSNHTSNQTTASS